MSDFRSAAPSDLQFRYAVAYYEAAWQSDHRPSIETFVLPDGPLGSMVRADPELFRELVLIDLEFRWRMFDADYESASLGTIPANPLADDYIARFPQYFTEPAQVAELVAEEHLVRHRWGDHPPLGDLEARYPGRADVVRAAEQAMKNIQEEMSIRKETDSSVAGESVTEEELQVGSTWGRYVVAQLLGSGSFGSVYRCFDPQLNRFVALKIVRLGTQDSCRDSVLHEARAAAAIRHPNVVTVFDIIKNRHGDVGIVTEFVAGESLEKRLKNGLPDLFDALRWTAAIAEGVHEAHVAGVVHRDLKPANIIIDSSGRPRVTDFGLALPLAERATASGEVAGTPRYMSPEQIRGDTHRLDGRSDVWSLGIMLYRLITGQFPFAEFDVQQLFQAIEHKPPPSPRDVVPHLPPQLEAVCLRCLEKDPQNRWATALELAQALRSFERTVGRAVGEEASLSVQASSGPMDDAANWSSLHRRASSSLPRVSSEIVGRVDDLARAEQALTASNAWLMTICGAGGVGKTRLAIEIVRRMKTPPGGVWWVDWSSARDGVSAAQGVLAALHSRLPERTTPEMHVAHVLGCLPPPVLVLDNAEQIIDAAAALLRVWSDRNPHVRFVVTSRERLHLAGEYVIELAPLDLPDPAADLERSASVQLFLNRARQVDPEFSWTPEQMSTIGAICRALEGLPLAIELAARRVNILSIEEIAADLNSRLESFMAGPNERADRQRTLTAAIAWSFDLLSAPEWATIVELSRFDAGFTRESAAAVLRALPPIVDELAAESTSVKGSLWLSSLGANLTDILQSLREKSLIRVRNTAYGRRFSMLEMIREYAGRLRVMAYDADTDARLEQRLALTLPAELAALRPKLTSATAAVVLERYADEAGNLEHIEDWAEGAGRPDVAVGAILPLVDAITLRGSAPDLADRLRKALNQLKPDERDVAVRGRLALARLLRHEGHWRDALNAAISAADVAGESTHLAEALRIQAEMQRRLGSHAEAETALTLDEAVAASAGPVEQALCQIEWGVLFAQRGSLSQAQTRLDSAAALLADGTMLPLEAEVERRRGQLNLQAGDRISALARLGRAEAAARAAGDLHSLQLTLASRGTVYVDQGRYEEALADFAEAERLARRLGDRRGLAVVWGNRAIALADLGDHLAALESFRRAEQLNREMDAKFGVAANLAGQGNVYALEQHFSAATAALDEAKQLAEASNFEFLAAIIQGDRGVARLLGGDPAAACDDLRQAVTRLEAVDSSTTHEVFCFAAFAVAALSATGDAAMAEELAARAHALATAGVVSRCDLKPRIRHAFQLLDAWKDAGAET